ncbi:MAG: thiamine pyrophosphate-dependent dehydrogenase E1 component subunit alpha [Candidatus Thorarchaeota archaeon]
MKSLKKTKLIEMYTNMVRIREFEEAVHSSYSEGLIATPGLLHLYIGEEAVAVGTCANLRDEDYIVSTHRGHGHCIAKGGNMRKMMAEIWGRQTGYCKGKGGSMHISDPEIGIVGCSGIVGAGNPIAAGVGYSIQRRGTDQVCVSFFGDGATNTGGFHEGISLAAAWNLPVIFVCENNLYAISVSVSKAFKVQNIADRASGYGIPGSIVDGMDVLEVYNAVETAVKRARNGKGPSLIECKTYRYLGHMLGDPDFGVGHYRSDSELKSWKARDPIVAFREKLLEQKTLSQTDIKKINEKVRNEAEDAVKFAEESPFPSTETALDDVFV